MYTTKNKDPDIEVEVNFENIYNIMAEKNKKQHGSSENLNSGLLNESETKRSCLSIICDFLNYCLCCWY